MQRLSILVVTFLCCASLADARAVAAQDVRHPHTAPPTIQAATAPVTTRTETRAGRTPIAAHDLARGAVLGAADIAWTDSVPSRFGARDSVQVGWVARRPFRTGEVLEPPGVAPPDLVSSGDAVNVIYRAPGVSI